MRRVGIVTDSTCDLPAEIIERLGITVLPLTVRFGQQTYRDGIDITPEEFFKRLKSSKDFPATSQVSVGQFTEAFERLSVQYEDIIGIFISSKLSGTYQSAVIAKNVLGLKRIHIVDSKVTTLALGLMVLEAAEMADAGKDADEIVARMTALSGSIFSIIALGTLTYVQRGGRISGRVAVVGNLLNIIPILTFDHGEVVLIDKVRGRKKILKWIVDYIDAMGVDLSGETVGINYIGCKQMANHLKDTLIDQFGVGRVITGIVGTVIGTYSGPDMAIGIYIPRKEG
jgi:DegV family protein with EDD domain